MHSTINISRMNKAEVLAKLFNASKAQGRGFLDNHAAEMSTKEAEKLLMDTPSRCFDYIRGRVMKVDLSADDFDPWLYDRDNGDGAASKALGVN